MSNGACANRMVQKVRLVKTIPTDGKSYDWQEGAIAFYLIKKIQTVTSYEHNQGRVRHNDVMRG